MSGEQQSVHFREDCGELWRAPASQGFVRQDFLKGTPSSTWAFRTLGPAPGPPSGGCARPGVRSRDAGGGKVGGRLPPSTSSRRLVPDGALCPGVFPSIGVKSPGCEPSTLGS